MTEFINKLDESEPKNKKTVFKKYLDNNMNLVEATLPPYNCDNVELLHRDSHGFDVMLAWASGRKKHASIYIGHWNEGC